jgi:hypothetical protein
MDLDCRWMLYTAAIQTMPSRLTAKEDDECPNGSNTNVVRDIHDLAITTSAKIQGANQ